MSSFDNDDGRRGGIPRTGYPGGWPGSPGGIARPDGRGTSTSQGSAAGSGARQAGFPQERPAFQTPRTHQEQFALRAQQQAQAGGSQAPAADGSIARVDPSQGITPVQAPAPSMPKGGGAVSAIAEKVSINPATGTTSYAVPLPLPPGRGGFGPQLSLQYSSGGGNGPFGLGWSVGVPSIGRSTSKALPQYRDDRDSDTFVMSGAEDLVPLLIESGGSGSGTWIRDVVTVGTERRERFRPRIEAPGSYARIERITDSVDGNVFWRSTTSNNVTNTYGKSASARLFDPKDATRIFRWLLEESRDDKGNVILYQYKAEDLASVQSAVHERHRINNVAAIAGRYLKRVLYAADKDVATPTTAADFHFEVVFDYGEHHLTAPTPTEAQEWPARQDAFSRHRAGFEERTYRLCRRVLIFHRFDELGASSPLLTRSTDFTYEEGPSFSYLTQVTQRGYTDGTTATMESLPTLTLDYSRATLSDKVELLDADSARNLSHNDSGRAYQWIDLDGEGISGALTQQAGAMYYKRNLGQGKLAPLRPLGVKPSTARLGGRGSGRGGAQARGIGGGASGGLQQLMDITGDGLPDLVELGGPAGAGYYPRTDTGGWGPRRAFRQLPRVDWNDPSLRFIDLNGDGFADVLMSEHQVYYWYPSLKEQGYGNIQRTPRYQNELFGPKLVFKEAEQSVFLADMTGDGLTDLVRVRNGSVCYWPNLGYGRFGPRVQMSHAPHMASHNLFSSSRIRLADIDGSGTADLLYIGQDGVHVYFNESGNGFADKQRLAIFPDHSALSSIDLVDLLGSGTSCLVWSTPSQGMGSTVRYVDLLSSNKPHLLKSVQNGLGLTTTITYTTSTKLYLADKAAGVDWATRLPFPVQVVERIEHYDAVAKHRFASTYRYRHGFYDTEEREFRGFGYVETRDAESVSEDVGQGSLYSYTALNGEMQLSPVVTKSWYHTGAWQKHAPLLEAFEAEWWAGHSGEPRLAFPPIPTGLTPPEIHQAHRALAGQLLRQEVYAEDGDANEGRPYMVSQSSAEVRLLQPIEVGGVGVAAGVMPGVPGMRVASMYGCFMVHPSETLSIHYERLDPAVTPPRITHQVVLAADELGHVTQSASVAYGHPDSAAEAEQKRHWLVAGTNTFVHELEETEWLRHGVPTGSQTCELDPALTQAGTLFTKAELATGLAAATIDFDVSAIAGKKRLLSSTRQRYWNNALTAELADGVIESLALPRQSYALALTPNMLSHADWLNGKITATMVTAEGGYLDLDSDGYYWARSGLTQYDAASYYFVNQVTDIFGNVTTMGYDAHKLLPTTTTAPLVGTTTAVHDYRLLAPKKVTDINGDFTEAAFDALGRVTKMAIGGSAGEGDSLAEPTVKHTYEQGRYETSGLPSRVKTEVRETHASTGTRWLTSYAYTAGSGALLSTKVSAEPGLAVQLDASGHPVIDSGTGKPNMVAADPRWVGTGRTIVDNKGNPIKQYEPYFSPSFEHEDDADLVEWGVSPLLHYDPLGRLIRTDMPNGSYSRVTFDPWEQTVYDENDTVLETGNLWYAARQPAATPAPSAAEQRAATLAAAHANTPAVTRFDALGRPFDVTAHNIVDTPSPGTAEYHTTKSVSDASGHTLTVTDARGNAAETRRYSMLGHTLRMTSNDAGSRRGFATAGGEPVRGWGERGFIVRTEYDALRRPTHVWVDDGAAEKLVERLVYGEAHASAAANRLKGQLVALYDQSGVVLTESYGFKGNLLQQDRRLATNYKTTVDWVALDTLTDPATILTTAGAQLNTETFTHEYAFDALNRPTSVTTPDSSENLPTYNLAGLLEKVDVKVRGAATATAFVTDIDYDEKGQRTRIDYSNDTYTEYTYDTLTHRLEHFKTTRTTDSKLLQSLAYTYDPVGNIVETVDTATQAVYFSATPNPVPSAGREYEYDAVYRLVEATGREHASGAEVQRDETGLPIHSIPHAADYGGLRRYTRAYGYDKVGNILAMTHTPASGPTGATWTRTYTYAATNNQLATTTHPGGSRSYPHDVHGNMTSMAHLAAVNWDFADQMQHVNVASGQDVYFVYDASGERVRKVYEHAGLIEERVYLGGCEVYRKHTGTTIATATLTEERETLHVADDAGRVCMVETLTVTGGSAVGTPTPRYRYQLGNHLGTVAVECDGAGVVISYEEFHPFGTSAYRAFSSSFVSARRYRYTGKEKDEETGLYYHGARYYAAWLGRWTSADPSGMVDGANLFAYVSGNPVVLSDPNGRESRYLGGNHSAESVARFQKTLGGNAYFNSNGANGTGWYVNTEGNSIVPIRTGTTAVERRGVTTVERADPVRQGTTTVEVRTTLGGRIAAAGETLSDKLFGYGMSKLDDYAQQGGDDRKLGVGVYQGLATVGYGSAQNPLLGSSGSLPLSVAGQAVDAYQEANGGAEGVLNAFNETVNPFWQFATTASAGFDAADRGDWQTYGNVMGALLGTLIVAAAASGGRKTTSPVKRRVKLREDTLKEIKLKQPRNAAGEMIDPNTGKPLVPGEIDVGHKTGQEWRTRKQTHVEQGSTRKQVLDAENNPDLYHLEDRTSNQSHRYEQKP